MWVKLLFWAIVKISTESSDKSRLVILNNYMHNQKKNHLQFIWQKTNRINMQLKAENNLIHNIMKRFLANTTTEHV